MQKLNLREIFDSFNDKTGNKLVCKKIYVVPSMRYWIDEKDQEVISAVLQLDNSPFTIKFIKFNPDLKNEEIEEILAEYLAQALTLGNHWEEYQTFKKKCTLSIE